MLLILSFLGQSICRDGKYEDALEKFESVLGSKPDANEASVASYNVACCYSKLDQVAPGFLLKPQMLFRFRLHCFIFIAATNPIFLMVTNRYKLGFLPWKMLWKRGSKTLR